jgi:WD40 repeat protein
VTGPTLEITASARRPEYELDLTSASQRMPWESSRALANLNPDGSLIATVSDEGQRVTLWPTDRKTKPIRLQHAAEVHTVVFSPDGKRLATAAEDSIVRLWSIQPDAVRPDGAFHHEAKVSALALGSTGALVATGGEDGKVRLWTDRGKQLGELPCASPSPSAPDESQIKIESLAFLPDGSRLLASTSGKSCLWATEPGRTTLLSTWSMKARFSEDGQRILLVSLDGQVKFLDARTSRKLLAKSFSTSMFSPELSPDGHYILVNEDERHLKVWKTDQAAAEPLRLPGLAGLEPETAVFDRKETRLALLAKDGTLTIWNLQSPDELVVLLHVDGISSVALSPDGRRALTVSSKGTVQIWNLTRNLDPRTIGDLFLFLRVAPANEHIEGP